MELALFYKGFSLLSALIFALYGLSSAFKKWGHGHKQTSRHIEIIEYKQIDQKHAISLVSVDNIRVLLVTGPSSILVQQIVSKPEKKLFLGTKPGPEIH